MRRIAPKIALICVFFTILALQPADSGGFDQCQQVIRPIEARIPRQWRPERAIVGHAVTPAELEAICKARGVQYRGEGWHVTGLTYETAPDASVYYVDRSLSAREFTRVVIHEYGHQIFQHRLTLIDQLLWFSVWIADERRPSAYAGSNPEDGFCEAFAHWRTKSSTQDRAESRWLLRLENDLKQRG